jgi:hypothetical protein
MAGGSTVIHKRWSGPVRVAVATVLVTACAGAPPAGAPTQSPVATSSLPAASTATAGTVPTVPAESAKPTRPTATTPGIVPSTDGAPSPVVLPEGELVGGIPDSVLKSTRTLWPPEAYGGFDEPDWETYELVLETPDELVFVDGRTGELTGTVPRPGNFQINIVIATPDSVWITDHDAGLAIRLDRETGEEVARIEIGGRAVSLLKTDLGLWAGAFHTYPSSVVLIDPTTNTLGRRIEMGAFPNYGMGSLWFGRREQADPDIVRRVDSSTGEEISRFPLNGAQGCYIGGSFPDAVWSWCFDPPPARTVMTRLDLEGGRVVTTLEVGEGLVGVASGRSWFSAGAADGLPDRLVAVDNSTNQVVAVYAFTSGFPHLAIVGDVLWTLDGSVGELRRFSLDDL